MNEFCSKYLIYWSEKKLVLKERTGIWVVARALGQVKETEGPSTPGN